VTGELDEMHVDRIRALSWPVRLRIVDALVAGPLEIDELAGIVHAAPSTVARHAAALRTIGLLEADRDGPVVRYGLADQEIAAACRLMRKVVVRRLARLGALVADTPAITTPSHPAGRPDPALQVTQA
jgi:DNA-binding transcriptional ArsR family regulator